MEGKVTWHPDFRTRVMVLLTIILVAVRSQSLKSRSKRSLFCPIRKTRVFLSDCQVDVALIPTAETVRESRTG